MQVTELKLKILGNPSLRKRSKPVRRVTEGHRQALAKMAQIMYENSGIGLASPQVGLEEAMVVIDIGAGLYKLINPKIIAKSGRQCLEEGCLSLPGICIKVKRANIVTVEALDENAKQIRIDAEGLFACVLQHEIDHLKAKLIVDYASFFQRLKIKKAIAELRKKAKDEKLSEPETKSCKLSL